MKFVDLTKTVRKGRANPSSQTTFQKSDAEDPQRLADTIRALQTRLATLEAAKEPEPTEVELQLTPGELVIHHGFKGAVRWYVTHWFGATEGPKLRTVSNEPGYLKLHSSLDGLAVIRIEPSQYGVTVPRGSAESVYGPPATLNGLRLTLTSQTPVTTANVASSSTVYLTPYLHGYISLWDGQEWVPRLVGEVSKTLGTLTNAKNYDVYAYWTGESVDLEFVAWSSDLARVADLERKHGVRVKPGDPTRRFVGTFRTTSTTTTADSFTKRFLWNADNQVDRVMIVNESTSSWDYTTASWRLVRGSSANSVEYVMGENEILDAQALNSHATTSGAVDAGGGIGIDSSSGNSANTHGGATATLNERKPTVSRFLGYPGMGYHVVNWIEYGGANVRFYGPAAATVKTGLIGRILA